MDKKNVMLLTVIAVATLLVAVVGATFAFFSLDPTNGGGTTKATVTTESLGTVALSNGGQSLYLKLTGAQMAPNAQGTYWAALTEAASPAASAVNAKVVTATVSNGEDGITYTCNGTLNVKLTGEGITASQLSGNVTLTGGSKTTFTSANGGVVALKDAAGADGVNVTYKMTAISKAATEEILANMSFTNTAENQDSLAGKTLTTSITSTTFTCDVDQPAA